MPGSPTTNYTKISQTEFKTWLEKICPALFEGLQSELDNPYHIPVSEHVWLRLVTRLESNGKVEKRGGITCRMDLVGAKNRQILPSPKLGSTRFPRDRWQSRWDEGIDTLFVHYDQNPDHYDRLGQETQREYKVRICESIGHRTGSLFTAIRRQLDAGEWLTQRQTQILEKILTERQPPKLSPVQHEVLGCALLMVGKMVTAGDGIGQRETELLMKLLRLGHKLFPAQLETLKRCFWKYRIYPPENWEEEIAWKG